MQKILLDHVGEAKTNNFSLRGYISRIFKIKKKRLSPPECEQKKFQEEVRERVAPPGGTQLADLRLQELAHSVAVEAAVVLHQDTLGAETAERVLNAQRADEAGRTVSLAPRSTGPVAAAPPATS